MAVLEQHDAALVAHPRHIALEPEAHVGEGVGARGEGVEHRRVEVHAEHVRQGERLRGQVVKQAAQRRDLHRTAC